MPLVVDGPVPARRGHVLLHLRRRHPGGRQRVTSAALAHHVTSASAGGALKGQRSGGAHPPLHAGPGAVRERPSERGCRRAPGQGDTGGARCAPRIILHPWVLRPCMHGTGAHRPHPMHPLNGRWSYGAGNEKWGCSPQVCAPKPVHPVANKHPKLCSQWQMFTQNRAPKIVRPLSRVHQKIVHPLPSAHQEGRSKKQACICLEISTKTDAPSTGLPAPPAFATHPRSRSLLP